MRKLKFDEHNIGLVSQMTPWGMQLLIGDKTLAELPDLEGKTRDYGRLPTRRRVSIEEFEADRAG